MVKHYKGKQVAQQATVKNLLCKLQAENRTPVFLEFWIYQNQEQ